MNRLFAPALLACINEGRQPEPNELESLAARLAMEAGWSHADGVGVAAHRLAMVAMAGARN